MRHAEHCDALAVESERCAAVVDDVDFATAVPTCPGWSVRDLVTHLGTVHRWAQSLVHARSPERMAAPDVELERTPIDAHWLRQGGVELVDTLRNADPDDAMWAWGEDQHVRFWSRRQLHETVVHRCDAELALGRVPEVDSWIATDAIDECLANLTMAARFSPSVRELRGAGERLRFRTRDTRRSWTVQLHDGGFRPCDPRVTPDASVSGPAAELLLILYRRRAVNDVNLDVEGSRSLVDFWLAHSALE